MMMVDGDAARALGVLARERWELATGRALRPAVARTDPWPPEVTPLVNDVQVAISRTEPPRADREAVCEIESLYVDLIAHVPRLDGRMRPVWAGRHLCGQEPSKDVMSPLAQRRRNFKVEALPTSTRRVCARNLPQEASILRTIGQTPSFLRMTHMV